MQEKMRRSVIRKFLQVGASSFMSKLLGIVREILQVKYFGQPGSLSDAFNVAFRIPNMLRKVFAEGALSAALVPTLVQLQKEDDTQLHKLVTLFCFILCAIILALCFIVVIWAPQIILCVAPGYMEKPLEFSIAVPLIRILIFFILFISSAALFAGVLQAKRQFLVISSGPIILNIAYITGLLICSSRQLPVNYLAFFLLGGGFFQAAVFIYMYIRLKFRFYMPDEKTWLYFEQVLWKFIPCLAAVSAGEINLFIDTRFASSLPPGQQSLLNLAFRFMAIALSLFAVTFSSVLLPYLSKITRYAPQRLGYYFLEITKLILWLTIPAAGLMFFFADDLFYTIFYRCTSKFSLEDVYAGGFYLRGFCWALSFFSVNKILLSIFYARNVTLFPSIVTACGAFINFCLNKVLVPYYGAFGLAFATAVSEGIQTIFFIIGFRKVLQLPLYLNRLVRFLYASLIQITIFAAIFFVLYYIVTHLIGYTTEVCSDIILHHIGLWLWVGPLVLALFYFMLKTRKYVGIKIYFLK